MKNYPLETVAPLSNIKEILLNGKKNCPEHIAFRYAKKDDVVEISYQKFLQDVAALSSELVSKNLFNEKIALIGENSYHWIVTYFAVVCSGNVIVPLDKELSLDEIRHIVEHSEAVALFYARDYDDVKDDLSSNSAVKHMWSLQGEVQGIFEKGTSVDVTAFEKLPVDEQKMCAIIYTSGTTGDPKGVMLSQHGLALDAYASLQNVRFKNDSLLILPLHHTFALTAAVLIPLHNQGTVAINLSLRTLADDIAKYKPQHLFLVPMIVETLYKKLIDTATKMGKMDQLPALSKMAFGGNLEIIVSGGAPINQQYIDGFKACGIYVLNGYGITECSPVVSVNRNDVQKDGSIGLVLPTCEVKIIDEEICVKGDIVMLGYYKNDEATKESMSDGYFHTGDLGYLDEDGFLFITGRKKNLIILSNGKNINPEELENKLETIKGIREVIVFEEKDSIVAEVFADETVENAESVVKEAVEELNKTLPTFKQIGDVQFRATEFPKTSTKKIKRNR